MKSLPPDWISKFLSKEVLQDPGYKLERFDGYLKLDQNETPDDLPLELKQAVCDRLLSTPWNRYTPPYPKELESLIASYAGVEEGSVLLFPGSNHLIGFLMDALCPKNKGQTVILRPSFPLYESYANLRGYPYNLWTLGDHFEFREDLLPPLKPNSLVFFASPNNPTGTALPRATLAKLLAQNESSYFIADEAYYEFVEEPYTPLLNTHHNLLILRTFSKVLSGAALRLGYLIAHPSVIEEMRKLLVPYLINPFTREAATFLLTGPDVKSKLSQRITALKKERARCFDAWTTKSKNEGFSVIPSEANFFLLQWPSGESCQRAYEAFLAKKIVVRNISKGPGLKGCLRLTLGKKDENQRALGGMLS